MPLPSGPIDTIDYLLMSLYLPEHLLFLQIHDRQLPLKIPETETGMRGGTGCEGATFDATVMLDR